MAAPLLANSNSNSNFADSVGWSHMTHITMAVRFLHHLAQHIFNLNWNFADSRGGATWLI